MSALRTLKDEAKRRGAKLVDCGNGHWQIHGTLLVNYYPESKRRTAYVAGTVSGRRSCDPAQAVAMAFEPPPFVPGSAKRKSSYRRIKVRLHKRDPRCHWCRRLLTLDEATVDHVIPLSRAGLDNANNRVLACDPCNQRRGNAMPEVHSQEQARCSKESAT